MVPHVDHPGGLISDAADDGSRYSLLRVTESPSHRVFCGWLPDVLLLSCFVLLAYFTRMTSLPMRGEEPRRARVAFEMSESGDWIVPVHQGDPFFMSCRPPLHFWTIALVGRLRGSIDEVAVRLPSAVAMLLTVLVIYGYSRTFLSRIGALAAALAYGTMGQVMELCHLGETDSIFALCVGGSLMVWHAGHARGWPAWRVWTAAYFLVALGTLTKGIQAPVYFAGGVGLFLLITGSWRRALAWPHAAGIAVFLAVWGAWQVPYFARLGWPGVLHVYFGDVVRNTHSRGCWPFARHLFSYPLEILCAGLMPWSVLFLLYLRRDFRRAIAGASGHVTFLACSILAAFPTVWLVAEARTRFFLVMYPAFAPLVGLVVERCCRAEHDGPWRKFWGAYLTAGAMVMAGAGLVILAASGLRPSLSIAQPMGFAAVFAVAALGLAAIAYWSGNARTAEKRAVGTLALAAFLGLAYTGVVINGMQRVSSPSLAPAVAELKRKLPEHVRLVSLGPADPLFAYYYRDSITKLPRPQGAEEIPAETEYFCFCANADDRFWPDFDFEQVGEINCDRTPSSRNRLTIVGRIPSTPYLAGREGLPLR
jgi:4-amino-4-deoxy-L-arabinose transferase-like glycosyltransferase